MLGQFISIASQNPILTGGILLLAGTVVFSILQGLIEVTITVAKIGGIGLLVLAAVKQFGVL